MSREFDSAAVRAEAHRYLDCSLADNTGARDRAQARIRGLRDVNTVNLWVGVEHDLDRGPRTTVVEWLDDRRDELGPDRVRFDEWLEAQPRTDVTPTESVARFLRRRGREIVASNGRDRGPTITCERRTLDAWRQRQSADDTDDHSVASTTDADSARPVAADGGTPEGRDD